MDHKPFIATPGETIYLKDYSPNFTGDFPDKGKALPKLRADVKRLAKYQETLYAQDTYALLIVIQAMDTAGKDGVIRHVMSGVNPQGCQVFSFKAPSHEELDHDYLWRCNRALPERGRIGIFNRSYYEEVLIVRVHPKILELQHMPPEAMGKDIWGKRFDEINGFEKHLVRNGTIILKFFLNVSKEEQRQRLLARAETPEKQWKVSLRDAQERAHWDKYMHAYEEMLNNTSTSWAPWHIIPADHKWFTRALIADIIVARLKSLKPDYPSVSDEHRQEIAKVKELLESEFLPKP
ncbi:MAG: polyphosphate kinase 2 family protein [Gammaproteobacteria bacterium]